MISALRPRNSGLANQVSQPYFSDFPAVSVRNGSITAFTIAYHFPELANQMASRGATALFVPSNNGLPSGKNGPEIVRAARRVDVATAIANGLSPEDFKELCEVIRAFITLEPPSAPG